VVNMLNRMLLRDLWHLRGQVVAAALVVACGIGALVATRGTYESLLFAQADYYRSYRFADVFAHLKRAPDALADDIRRIPGVAQVRTRIVADVSLDVPGLAEPAIGRLVSIPERRVPMLNDLRLVRGEYVTPHSADQVLVSEAFAKANRLNVGDTIGAVLHGRWKQLAIAGIALSPEYIYEVGPGMLLPDNRRFGVMWMAREALGPAFDMEGAFNDVALSLAPGATDQDVIAALDVLLRRYGGLSAYPRDEQLSHRFLTDELGELEIMTTFIPALFLGVAAFLLYVVLTRLVATQRTEIGLLKAFGRSNARIGLHYLYMAMATVAVGALLGLPLGLYLGGLFVDLYRDYFYFPRLVFIVEPSLLLLTVGVSLLAAAVGALVAVRRAVTLAPAEAMRPEPPASYRTGLMGRGLSTQRLPASVRMISRNLVRKPWKAFVAVLGMALAVGLMVVGRFALDAGNYMMAVEFNEVLRSDVAIVYNEPRPARAAHDVAKLTGVTQSESFRIVPAWLRHAHREKRVEVLGLGPRHELRRLLDKELRPVYLPPHGLVMTKKLGEILGVAPGDMVTMEVLEGARPVHEVPVAGFVDEFLGLNAYMDAGELARLMHEDRSLSGAYLRVRSDLASQLYAQLKRLPVVGGVTVLGAMQASLRELLNRTFSFFSWIQVLFACVIIVGMVYNSSRIALSERGNELASLSVLGFTRREVTVLLLGEQAILIALAIPIGLAVGYGLCAALVPVFDRELFRMPLVVGKLSFLYPVIATLAAAAVSGFLVARRIRHLDLIAVLKTRE